MRVIFMDASLGVMSMPGQGRSPDQVADVAGRRRWQRDAEAALQRVGNELEAGAVAHDLEGPQVEQGR